MVPSRRVPPPRLTSCRRRRLARSTATDEAARHAVVAPSPRMRSSLPPARDAQLLRPALPRLPGTPSIATPSFAPPPMRDPMVEARRQYETEFEAGEAYRREGRRGIGCTSASNAPSRTRSGGGATGPCGDQQEYGNNNPSVIIITSSMAAAPHQAVAASVTHLVDGGRGSSSRLEAMVAAHPGSRAGFQSSRGGGYGGRTSSPPPSLVDTAVSSSERAASNRREVARP